MASASRKTILTISRDQPLQRTRTLILQQAGYAVFEASNQAETLALMASVAPIDLVVICHSVPAGARELLAAAIKREYPSVSILMMYLEWKPRTRHADGFVNVAQGTPAAWLGMVGLMSGSALREPPASA